MAQSSWNDILNTTVGAPLQEFTNQIKNFTESTLGEVIGKADDVGFGYDTFPQDLSSSYYGHWMTITAMLPTPGSTFNSPTSQGKDLVNAGLTAVGAGVQLPGSPNTPAYTAGLFIPSNVGAGGGLLYNDKHDYADIRLTNLGSNLLGTASGGTMSLAGYVPPMFGHPINPGVEVLYRSTNLRRHEYSFLLAPSSEKESMAMKNIVKNLRRFAAPKLNEKNKFLFDTPAEWEIQFYFHGQENTNIPKIARSVLTDINIDYSPQGEWSTFRNGHPVACMLQLGFNEMEIMTRQHIEKGY